MHFKKVVALLLSAGILTATISGCSNKTTDNASKSKTDPTTYKGEIELMLPQGDYIEFAKKNIVPYFEKKFPNVKVVVTDDKNIETRVAAGDAPTVYAGVWGYQPVKFAKMDKLVNYEKFADYKELESRINEKYLGKVLDGTYYVPWNATTTMMIYNKELFKEAGLDPEKPPVTFDEFLEYAKKISALPNRKDGSKTYGTVFWNEALSWGGWYWSMLSPIYYNANEGKYQLLNKTGTDIVFDKPEAKLVEFFKFVKEAQKYAPPNMEKNFFSRNIGMWLQFGYGWKANLKQAAERPMEIGKDVGVAPVPVLKSGQKAFSSMDGRALMIFKSNPEKEALAWELVKFMMQDDINLEACKALGQLPTLKSLENDPYFQTEENKPFVEQLKNSIPNEAFSESDSVQNIILQTYGNIVVQQNVSIDQGIKDAAVKAREVLKTSK